MRDCFLASACAVILALVGVEPHGQDEATVETPPSLASVAWAGPAPDPTCLEGKTVVVLTYVTWCPKCNAWTGKVAAELKQQSADKPVVVLAISTDTPPPEALAYMQERGLVGPNIFHGSEPTIAKRFGFANEFINYAIVSPEGKVVDSGNGGSSYSDGNKPAYACARYLAQTKDLGTLRFVRPELPQPVKDRLWLAELGVSRDFKKLEAGLAPADRESLQSVVQSFIAAQAAELDASSKSDVLADKLAAFDKASYLVSRFATTPEGRRAKEILADFGKDKTLKDELNAKRQYDVAIKIADPVRRKKALESLAKKLAETEFGKKAASEAK